MKEYTYKQLKDLQSKGCLVYIHPRARTVSVNGFPAVRLSRDFTKEQIKELSFKKKACVR